MKKKTYLAKYENTLLADNTTKADAEKAKKTVSQLKGFLKEAALDYFKKTEGIDLLAETQNGKTSSKLGFQLDEKPNGTVTISVTHFDEKKKVKAEQVYYVPKDRLFAA